MRRKSIDHYWKQVADAWLVMSVHFDAFWSDPRAYMVATKWWIKRRRVRARGQFAALLGQSPRAYMLWALRQEYGRQDHSPLDASRSIVPLVDVSGNADIREFDATCQSLAAEGLKAVVVGSMETPNAAAAIAQIEWACDPWLLPIRSGDRIAPGTAAAYRRAMADNAARIIYADDDILIGRRRSAPYFKPDWNYELFQHSDYLSGACAVHATRAELEAVADTIDWVEQLVIGIAAEASAPIHLREMLHHRRQRPTPRFPAMPLELACNLPPVSIIVPTRNRVDLLRTCLEGVAAADYPDVEVIVVDNDSDDPETLAYLAGLNPERHKVLRYGGAFNYSAINNRAAEQARGTLLCLLNNDVEMIDTRWLATLATQALRPEVGAVGARLLYPDGRIQHAGVVIGVGNAAGHAHRFLRPDEDGYFHRHNLPQFTSAVTAACLVVERTKFMAVGGLNERDFAVAFNDVDLCLRLNQQGWQSLYEPRATLIHHESVSRGLDQDPVGAARFSRELAALKRIWKTDEIYDPYHHPQLSRASEQFTVAL
jgi:GT2 family glycosyltransferase